MLKVWRAVGATLGLAVWGGTSAARAAEVDVRSSTVFGGRPDVVDGKVSTVVPLTESVGLSARHIENPLLQDLAISLDAWGTYDLSLGGGRSVLSSDVNVASIEGKLINRRLRLRLGRQVVQGGSVRLLFVDGLSAEVRGPLGLGAHAYVGSPVARRFGNLVRGDLAAGGRLFWAPSFTTEVGVSVVHATEGAQLARQDVGADARIRLHRTLSLNGSVAWSLAEGRLIELDVGPRWQPRANVEVLADYRRQAPDLLLPRTSILSVFAATSRDDAGLSVFYAPSPSLSAYGEGRLLLVTGERGYDAGLRGTWRPDRLGRTTVTAQVRRLYLPDNGYVLGRLAGRRTFGELALSLDLEAYRLDKAVRDQAVSLSVAANATWQFAQAWRAGLTAFGATTPTFESRYEVIAKLVYTFAGGASKAE